MLFTLLSFKLLILVINPNYNHQDVFYNNQTIY